MAVYLNPCISLPLNMDENDFQVLIQNTKDWTLMHGNYNLIINLFSFDNF